MTELATGRNRLMKCLFNIGLSKKICQGNSGVTTVDRQSVTE
ncbi:13939_t:CDS:2 [Dentiscutata heterogama]|uniref:13939_t:CDS:1 n=1 Tax=Dentiscutata heterogama TaxID=1316150 RepID=A0ACA9K7P5_9GLOM|nr:13939_t:CDS:2 [Dentiscutata heterogama]